MLRKIYKRILDRRTDVAGSPFFTRYPTRLRARLLNSYAAIQHDNRFAYFRIGKAANSTVVATLHYAITGDRVVAMDDLQLIKDSSFSKLSDLNTNEVATLVSDYFTFTFVRNPYVRLLSGYLDKVIDNPGRKRKIIAKKLKKSPKSEITLADFLDYIEDGGIDEDGHWSRQVDLLPIPHAELNFIGRVENLATELPLVMERIFHRQISIVNAATHATAAQDATKELDSSTKERIYRLYQADFEILGYPRTC